MHASSVCVGAVCFALLALLAAPALGAPIVLTFDDLPDPGAYGALLPSGYGGLSWTGMLYHRNTGAFANGSVSQPHVAFNLHGGVATVSGDEPFGFVGAYFTGAYNDGLNIRIEGLRTGQQVYDRTIVVSYAQPAWHDLNYEGIDQLRFTSWGGTHAHVGAGQGTHFVMDNFTIPEPATLALLVGGALVQLRRRRRSTAAA